MISLLHNLHTLISPKTLISTIVTPVMSSIKAQTVAAIPSGSVGTAIAGLDALPKGFPISVPDHVSFVGQDFVNNTPFIYHLTDSEVVAIKQALEEFKSTLFGSLL